jgi:DNA-binding NarL/FixJ family response regulator
MKINSIDRVERLLASILLYTTKIPQREKAFVLSRCGFSNIEIADLMNITAQAVANYLYEKKKAKKKKKQ